MHGHSWRLLLREDDHRLSLKWVGLESCHVPNGPELVEDMTASQQYLDGVPPVRQKLCFSTADRG